jgi:hypothetical protein
MEGSSMARHVIDKRALPQGGRLRNFLRLARQERAFWHRSEACGTNRRVVEFLRIDRGRTV